MHGDNDDRLHNQLVGKSTFRICQAFQIVMPNVSEAKISGSFLILNFCERGTSRQSYRAEVLQVTQSDEIPLQ